MSSNIYTADDLKVLQALNLDQKIALSITRIIEWYEKNDGKVYISFSGGKDSTVLLHIVRNIYPDVPAVFIDTGLEFPEIKQFVKTFDNVIYLRPEMNFKEVLEKYGYPLISKEVSQSIYEARMKPDGYMAKKFDSDSEYCHKYDGRYCLAKWQWLKDSDIPISDRCCKVMKKKPAKDYESETGNKPYLGMMAYESRQRKNSWQRSGCNSFNAVRPNSQPLAFWMEQDILQYISQYNLPVASVYGDIVQDKNGKYKATGEDRTGCVFCAYGAQLGGKNKENKFQRLKRTHPQLWEYCMKPVTRGGLGMREVLEYIGVKVE